MNYLPFESRVRAVSALVEGCSQRATARLVDVHRDTVSKIALDVGFGCMRLLDRLVRDVRCSVIELDEQWTYVRKKQRHLVEGDSPECGDQFIYIALDATSKLVISHYVAKRDGKATRYFLRDVRARVIGRPQISSDGYEPYVNAVDEAFGTDCAFAMITKVFTGNIEIDDDFRFSAPGHVLGTVKKVVMGDPDPAHIGTSHVERLNLTGRMHMRRLTRRSNGFSKRLPNLEAAVALHVAWYNFCRVHEAIRVTPAMQAGLTDHVWTIGELIEMATASPAGPAFPPAMPPAWPPPEANRRQFRVIQGGRHAAPASKTG